MRALELLGEMKNLEANVITYNAAVSACERNQLTALPESFGPFADRQTLRLNWNQLKALLGLDATTTSAHALPS